GLAGPADVAVNLVRDIDLGQRGVLAHEGFGLRAGPAHRVDAGVDAEPRGAPRVVAELAEAIEIARVQAHLVGKALGVQRPTFDERGRALELAKRWQRAELLRDRDLQVMARDRLVPGQRLELEARPRL